MCPLAPIRHNSRRDPLSERSRRGQRPFFVIHFSNGAVEQEGLDILDGLHGIILNTTANLVEGDDSSTSLFAVFQTTNQLQNGHGQLVDLSDGLD